MNRIEKISLEDDNLNNKMNKYYHLSSSLSFYSINDEILSFLNDLINNLMNNYINLKEYEETSDIINNSIRYIVVIDIFTRLHVILHNTVVSDDDEERERDLLSNALNELSITLNTLIPV